MRGRQKLRPGRWKLVFPRQAKHPIDVITSKAWIASLARISHQFAYRHRIVVCRQYVMIICSLYRHNRLRLMRPRLSFCRQRARVHCAHPPAYNRRGRLWAQPCGRLSPCKSSVLTICPSTRATAMLSVPVSSTGQAPAPAGGTNLPGADLDVQRTPAGGAPRKAHIKNPARSSHQLVRNAG